MVQIHLPAPFFLRTILKFASVCSGIEAATIAFTPLGFQPVFYSEIDRPTCRFLASKFPETPNYGDIRGFASWPNHKIDLLIGGTPCQSFSLRGKRRGIEDERGQIAYSFFGVVEKYRPEWVIWENTPGVLSSNGGRDFGSFLGSLAKLGYGFAYRVLDAQYFGIPQRRRRIYLVGCLGDEKRAAKVLFQPGGVYGTPPATRRTPETIAKCVIAGTGRRFDSETETLIVNKKGVRRLMPIECERLQGFPDNFTLIQIPGRQPTSDSFRYKAIGNSMAVPVISHLGRQIMNLSDGRPKDVSESVEMSEKKSAPSGDQNVVTTPKNSLWGG